MSKVKSIFKRSLAILLAMLTVLSVGLTSAIALNLDMAQTAGYVDLAETGAETIYLKYQANMPSANYNASSSKLLTQSTNASNRYYCTLSLSANTSYGFFILWGSDYYKASATASSDVSVSLSNYGSTNYGNSSNRVTFTTGSAGNYIFTFDTNNKKIVVSPETDTVKLAYDVASGHDSWYNLNNYETFTKSGDSTYILDLDLTAQKYYMFVQLKSSAYWRGTSTLTTSNVVSVYSYGTDNYGNSADKLNFTPSSAGTYRFTWNHADKTISVAKLTYNVKKSETGGTGTVKLGDTTLTTSNTALSPGEYNLNITAPSNYNVSSVSVSGGSLTTAGTTGSSTYAGVVSVNAATTINVTYVSAAYSYTVTAGTGGTVSPASGTVTPGSGVTVTAQANEGYTFTGWTGTNGSFADASALSTTFTPTATGAVATANFAKNTYTVTFNDHDGTFLGTATVSHGGTATAPVTPSRTGYTFDGWSESLTNVTGNMTVTAQYTINEYDLTISGFDSTKATMTIDGQTYTANTTITKEYGETAEVVITPNEGQVLTVNGEEVTYGESYEATITFDEDQTLTLGFNIKTFDVTITHDWGRSKSVYIGTTQYEIGPTSVTNSIPYGTQTLKITASENYYIESVVGNGVNYNDDGSMADYKEFDIFVTSDCEITIELQSKPMFDIKITTITDGTTETFLDTSESYGKSYTINVPAKEGYYISRVTGTINGASVNLTSEDYSNSTFTQTIDSLTADTELTVYYTAIPTFNVTVAVNDANGGTATGTGIKDGVVTVYSGSKAYLSATANTGYRFTGWTVEPADAVNTALVDLSQLAIDFVPQEDVIVTANFEAVTGTINVTAGEGGTVTNEGTNNVTYPETITATATPNESEGYQFTHWTVESDGEVNVDYKVTEDDNVITVQILTQDTVVNVTANFANAQNIKVYTYSDSGFDRLTITESNGTTTNTPVNNVTQSPVTFGEETWYTPGEVSLTPGFNTSITAQLLGDNPLVGGTGTLIMFDNVNVNWSKVHLYTNIKAYDSDGADLTNNGNHYALQNISGTTYWYTYISSTSEISSNVLFCDSEVGGWNNLNSGQKASYRTDASSNYSAKPMFRPDAASNETLNGCPYYNNGSWVAKPTIDTDTDVLDITSMLYDGNAWKGLKEIWLYFDKAGNTVVATQRRDLNDYVTSAAVVQTYNNGKNDKGYDSSWDTFTAKYKAAVAVLGNGASTDDQLLTAKTDLETAIKNLKLTENVTIIGSYGAEPQGDANTSIYYGRTTFEGMTTSTASGNIGDANGYHNTCTYITGSVKRDTVITIKTQLESSYVSDYLVYGWVVNGTGWIPATADIDTAGLYVGTYKCEANAVIVPIYFHKNTANNWETDSNIVKVYASTKGASEEWGNYIASYTWTTNKSYYQFGHWTGQLMIPDTANPGMYYTFVEMADPDNMSEVVAGITFNNYGANTPINQGARYQTYDYYEFIQLKNDEFNNIVFQLKTFEGNENYPQHNQNLEFANYKFDYFRDFSGSLIDIGREKIVEERTIPDPALYIVRTGPLDYNEGADQGWGNLKGSEFYVDAYLYKPDGTYLGRCKTYELTNLAKLKETRGIDLTTEEYVGKPVMVDYASLTNEGGNLRFDGEWFGTIYGLTNVTIKAEVAFQNEDGSIRYFQGQNNVDDVGQAYFNGEHFQEVPHASEGHTISAIVAEGNDFVGWYKAIVADDGSYTIDTTANPLFIERSATIDASADAVYIAVFKKHPEGTFTVNNYYYTYKDFEGQPMGEHLPPVFGGDTSYSIRDVRINKIYDAYTQQNVSQDLGFAGTYTQSMENISVGDQLEITIKTKPTYGRDYVYAWYILAADSYGVNFEEIGTNVIQNNYEPGASKEFTFTYTVEEGVNNITIYSDVVHITPEVTFTYIYNNRYNETKTYVVKYTLTNGELTNYTPSNETIRDLAPYVGDIYKNVTWEIDNISSDATNWTLRATEADVYTVNINVDGKNAEPIYGKFNETVSIYAKDINPEVMGNKGIWYVDKVEDGEFVAGEDEILGYGTYYGLVITGDVNVCFTSEEELMNQIILADAVYGYERATDGSGNETINKVYVDYLISMLLNVYTGGFIDVNGNSVKDENEPTVIDEENTNTPVSLKAIETAGYEVDYGMVHELLNTFGTNKDDIITEFYGKESTAMSDTSLTEMLIDNKATANGATDSTGALATLLYKYSAIDYKDYATNKNRVIMTFGFDNTEYYRNLYYNVKAYLTISAPETTTMTDDNTLFLFSNTATLNIAEDDKVTNGEATNS